MTDRGKAGVALVNWNGGEFTIPCVESLLASEPPPWRIVVVDNASTDGSPDAIANRFPQVQLIRCDRNLGFAGGTNVAVRALLDAGADLIWILNNDTVVQPTCLDLLSREIEREGEGKPLAAVSAMILFQEPGDVIWYAGGNWSRWTLAAPHRGEGEVDRGQYDRPEDVGFLSGCCILARAEALRKIGLFDERFVAYHEDADWCLRALKAGYRLRYVPTAVLWHKVSASIRKNTLGRSRGFSSPRSYYLSTRNRIYVLRAHAGRPVPYLTALAALLLRGLFLSVGFLALGRLEKLTALWRGFRAGFRASDPDQIP